MSNIHITTVSANAVKRRWRFVVAAIVLTAWLLETAHAAVVVRQKPVAVEYHTFDPRRPPKEINLHPGEAAVCKEIFGVAVQLEFTPDVNRQRDGSYAASMKVARVVAELELKIDVWLPTNATPKLKAHEEGHRQIAEKIYNEVSDKAIRVAAATMDGKAFTGEGETSKEAQADAQQALNDAHNALNQDYVEQTSRAGVKVQEEYDRITAHGTKLKVAEADAIAEAWVKYTPPLWTPPEPPATNSSPKTTRRSTSRERSDGRLKYPRTARDLAPCPRVPRVVLNPCPVASPGHG